MNKIDYSKLYGVLVMLGKRYVYSLPDEVFEKIQQNIDPELVPVYDVSSIDEIDDLSEEVLEHLVYFRNKYWNNL